jgi:uncharacterized protein RhaS with RHS repeats
MRMIVLAAALALAPWTMADDVPQAVAALRHLTPQTHSGPTAWTAGPYQYDAAGNISAIGSEAYVYDSVGRLTSATLRGPDMTTLQTQAFGYDTYGNLTSTAKLGQTVLLPTTPATNRLDLLGYDAAGNVITAGTQHYGYDAVGMPSTVHLGTAAQLRIVYAYTADDERLFAYDLSTNTTHWTLRGFDNKVLRDFKQTGSTWSVDRDYVYRDGLLLAALKPSGAVEHYSLDHLGTPRLVTDASGHRIAYHVYWPFGEEWSPGTAQEASPQVHRPRARPRPHRRLQPAGLHACALLRGGVGAVCGGGSLARKRPARLAAMLEPLRIRAEQSCSALRPGRAR